MSMMNANVAATTAMTANKPLDFELPEIGEAEFSNEELAEDIPPNEKNKERLPRKPLLNWY